MKRLTGEPLREYARKQIFEPLGMTNTHFHDRPAHTVKRRAMSYERDDRGGFRISYLGNFDKVGAGGLYSTVRDLLLWDRNFYTGDVGGQRFLELIQTPGVLADGERLTYAFGLNVDQHRGVKTVGHGGSMMGFKELGDREWFRQVVVKTKNKFYEMRGTLDHLQFEVVKFERHPRR